MYTIHIYIYIFILTYCQITPPRYIPSLNHTESANLGNSPPFRFQLHLLFEEHGGQHLERCHGAAALTCPNFICIMWETQCTSY